MTGAVSRIAVAALAPSFAAAAVFEASLESYPGYSGALATGGSVTVTTSGTGDAASQILEYRLDGADVASCATTPVGVGNACGIHIHSGVTCSDASQVGGHFWPAGSSDPWSAVVYTSASGTTA